MHQRIGKKIEILLILNVLPRFLRNFQVLMLLKFHNIDPESFSFIHPAISCIRKKINEFKNNCLNLKNNIIKFYLKLLYGFLFQRFLWKFEKNLPEAVLKVFQKMFMVAIPIIHFKQIVHEILVTN